MQQTAGGDLHVKLLDFGIAKSIDGSTKMTKTGQIFGTPQYMSPEQCGGETVDGRSDLYALGCIMHEMLTGSSPFEGDNVMAVLMAHINDEPPPIECDPPLSDQTRQVIATLLEKSRERRFADASALRAALASSAPQLQNSAPRGAATAVLGAHARTSVVSAIGQIARPRARSGPRIVALTGLALVLLMAVAGSVALLLSLQDGGPSATAAPVAAAPSITAEPSASEGALALERHKDSEARGAARGVEAARALDEVKQEKPAAKATKRGEPESEERTSARPAPKRSRTPRRAKPSRRPVKRTASAPPKKRASKPMPKIKSRPKRRPKSVERKLNRAAKAVDNLFSR